jgi:hypothetical protein
MQIFIVSKWVNKTGAGNPTPILGLQGTVETQHFKSLIISNLKSGKNNMKFPFFSPWGLKIVA